MLSLDFSAPRTLRLAFLLCSDQRDWSGAAAWGLKWNSISALLNPLYTASLMGWGSSCPLTYRPEGSASATAAWRAAAMFHSHRMKATPTARPARLAVSQRPVEGGGINIRPASVVVALADHPSGRKRNPARPIPMKNTPIAAVTTATMISVGAPLRSSAGWNAKIKGTT